MITSTETSADAALPLDAALPEAGSESREATGSRYACAVKLGVFEGPLDLLLHLIRSNEVDVTDIPIARISEQYLEYLEWMKLLDIDVAAEYLLMAATLAHIKSRMLLPGDPESDDGDVPDPREELARRLAEYARYKEVAVELGGRPRYGRDTFSGIADKSGVPEPPEVLSVSLYGLVEAMGRVLARIPEEERHHQVSVETLTLQDRMVWVMDALREAGADAVLFERLLADGVPTRAKVVVTFLSILELARIQAIVLFQNTTEASRPEGPIRVRLAVSDHVPDDAAIVAAAVEADAALQERFELPDGGEEEA